MCCLTIKVKSGQGMIASKETIVLSFVVSICFYFYIIYIAQDVPKLAGRSLYILPHVPYIKMKLRYSQILFSAVFNNIWKHGNISITFGILALFYGKKWNSLTDWLMLALHIAPSVVFHAVLNRYSLFCTSLYLFCVLIYILQLQNNVL